MKTTIIKITFLLFVSFNCSADENIKLSSFWEPSPRNYEVKQAFEVESLFPMFFYGGYHYAIGYRYKKFRVRFSIINGGTYNAENAGIDNNSDNFKRYYTTSPGIFYGYNLWKNLELYSYLEFHKFEITQISTGDKQFLRSIDTGLGLSYQFFIGRYLYIQPGVHWYVRGENSLNFGNVPYKIPNQDVSVIARVGLRLWRKYK